MNMYIKRSCLILVLMCLFLLFLVLQLDDWVLCRVRQKTSSPRSTWEDSNEPSYDPKSYFQQLNNENPNPEPVKNYAYNEFPMLPYILASKGSLPSIGMASSSISFQCSNNGKGFSSDNSNIIEAQFLAYTAESLKRKPEEEDQLDQYYAPPFKKLSEEDHERGILHTAVSKDYTSSFNNFDSWASVIQPQELNNLAFAGYI